MKRVRLVVAAHETSLTLRELLTGRGGLSEEVFDGALAAGAVTVNRKRQKSPAAPLALRDEVLVTLEERGRKAGETPALAPECLLHLDSSLVAVNKPPNIAAQGTLSDARAGLDAALEALLKSRREPAFVGLVHRLDFETSGITVFGRSPEATSHLAASFRDSKAQKSYLLLAHGSPDWDSRLVEAPLGPHPSRTGMQAVLAGGKPARTFFTVKERLPGAVLLEARPETGRTHQIRVHAAHLGHPLLGDRRYGGEEFLSDCAGLRLRVPRVALHAASLELPHPKGGLFSLSAPLPMDLQSLLSGLRPGGEGR